MKASLLGLLVGAVVVFDPVVTAYFLRDFSWLHHLPYFLSITVVVILSVIVAARHSLGNFAVGVIDGYWRQFPFLFLLAYQFTGISAGPLDATEITMSIFMLLYCAGLFVRQDQRFVSTPFNMLHVAFAICLALSLTSQFRPASFIKCIKPLVVFFLLVNFLSHEGLIRPFVRRLVILGMLSAAFGLVQELVWWTTRTQLSLVDKADLDMMLQPFLGLPTFRIPAMMTGYRNLAMYLSVAIILSIGALLWRREGELLRPRWLILGLCVMIPAVILTVAHDMYIGVTMGIMLLLLMYRPIRFIRLGSLAALAGAAVLLTAIAVTPGNVDRAIDLTKTVPKSEQERIRLDRDSIENFLHGSYFWIGRGVGAGAKYTAHSRHWPAHNAYILVAAEVGIAGLLVFVLVHGLVIARAVALNIMVKSGPYLFIVRSLLPIMVVVMFGEQFTAAYADSFIWIVFALVEVLYYRIRGDVADRLGSQVST